MMDMCLQVVRQRPIIVSLTSHPSNFNRSLVPLADGLFLIKCGGFIVSFINIQQLLVHKVGPATGNLLKKLLSVSVFRNDNGC